MPCISAVHGYPGSGKSRFAIWYCLELAEKYQKRIVANFPFNLPNLAKYCRLMNYRWLVENLDRKIIIYVPTLGNKEDIISFFAFPDSILLWDEVAKDLPSRGSTYNTPRKVIEALVEIRHERQYLIYISQNDKQIDSQLRNLTEEYYHCIGILTYSRQLRSEQMVMKTVHRFLPDNYQVYLGDPKVRRNPIKVKILAAKSWRGFLNGCDVLLFDLYESLKKLESQSVGSSNFPLAYAKTSKGKFYVAVGRNPYNKFHSYQKYVTWFLTKLPSKFLPWVLKLDKYFCKYPRFNSMEKFVIKFLGAFSLLIVLGFIF